jgi:hypothetical protein
MAIANEKENRHIQGKPEKGSFKLLLASLCVQGRSPSLSGLWMSGCP